MDSDLPVRLTYKGLVPHSLGSHAVYDMPPPSLSLFRREFRFHLTPSLSLSDVAAEIRKQTDMTRDAPFNLKWLDVEGRG